MTDILVITGMSGAGRSQASANLEDLGWFVIDNLPAALIEKVTELAVQQADVIQRLALVVGRPDIELPAVIERLRAAGDRVRILFLDASDAELVKRYSQTRRRHPHAGDGSVLEAVQRERAMLTALRASADRVVDTTGVSVHQLRGRLTEMFGSENDASSGLQVTLTSFGFKHGLPLDVDQVFDVRFLRNPFWVEDLRPQTGLDQAVKSYVLDDETAQSFVTQVAALLALTLPAHEREGRSYVTIAIGCTGGHHRSVAVAEELGRRLRATGRNPRVTHRDIERAQ